VTYVSNIGPTVQNGTADARDFVTVRDVKVPVTCTVRWNNVPADDGSKHPSPETVADEESARRRLKNLSYFSEDAEAGNILAFQRYYERKFGLAENGVLDAPTKRALKAVHDSFTPDPFTNIFDERRFPTLDP